MGDARLRQCLFERLAYGGVCLPQQIGQMPVNTAFALAGARQSAFHGVFLRRFPRAFGFFPAHRSIHIVTLPQYQSADTYISGL